MKYLIALILILTCGVSIGQIYNPVPQYVYKNKLGVGRSASIDSSAYLMVGPNGTAIGGIVLPRVDDTLSILGTKRHGLMIFSKQLDIPVWYDSTNARWTEMGSGGVTAMDAVVLVNGSMTLGDSLLFSNTGGDTAYVRTLIWSNGISSTVTDTTITPKLGGSLTEPTVIVATSTNPLVLQGVEGGGDIDETITIGGGTENLGLSVTSGLTTKGNYLILDTLNFRAKIRDSLSSYNKVIVWDSANNVIGYRHAANFGSSGSGSVTSVSSGYGTSFSTITTTGSVIVDTAAMSTRARVQKGIDSIGALNKLTNVGSKYHVAVEGTNNVKTLEGAGGITLDSATTNVLKIDGSGLVVPPSIFSMSGSGYNGEFIVPMTGILKINNSYILNDPITWVLLQTAGHGTIFIDSVYGSSNDLIIKYPETKNVFSMQITPDEAFSATGVFTGGSIALNQATFKMNRVLKAGVRLQGAGTNTWTVTGNTSLVTIDTFNRSNGVTRYTRNGVTSSPTDALAQSSYDSSFMPPQYMSNADSIHYLSRVTSALGSFSEAFKTLKSNGQPLIAELPLSTDFVYIDLGTFINPISMGTFNATNQFMSTSYNWWVDGWFESYIKATPTTTTSNVIKIQEYAAATGYKIYRSTTKWGTRTLIGTATDDGSATHTITDNTATTGTFYYYWMIATIASVDTDITYFTCLTK